MNWGRWIYRDVRGGEGVKPEYHVVNLSGGKDSTAMLLMMIEKNMPIDEIIFCDTTVEFPEMYKHISRLEKYIGMSITILRADKDFEHYLLYYKKTRGKYMNDLGYSFPWTRSRWCTSILKTNVIDKYFKEKSKHHNIIQYVGIAYDEPNRIKDDKNIKYPLHEWGVTEQQALEYCYNKGFDWGGLYKEMKRVSCWCCPLQSIGDVRNLYQNHRELWNQLETWQNQTWKPFRNLKTVQEYARRFQWEKENPNKKFYWKYIEVKE